MFDLLVLTGKLEGRRLLLPLGKDIVIGREEGCQIVLPSTLISRQHCRLRRTEQGLLVQDLASQNGTFVNDVPIDRETLLTVGDTLRVGAIVFEVHPHATQAAGSPPASSPPSTTPPPSVRNAIKRTQDQPPASGISDYEIAAWLSDQDTATVPAATDTTIIRPARTTPAVTPAVPAVVKPPSSHSLPTVKPQKFRSVKEEAADIIRRHWAKVREEQAGNADSPAS